MLIGELHIAGDSPVREPAARDVAQMRTSLAHIGQIVDRPTGGVHSARITEWTASGAMVFLDSYRNTLAARSLQWLIDDRLLRPFEVEQECRELIYSAKYLRPWRYAPMGVLHSWPDETPKTATWHDDTRHDETREERRGP
jgi:maltokinase